MLTFHKPTNSTNTSQSIFIIRYFLDNQIVRKQKEPNKNIRLFSKAVKSNLFLGKNSINEFFLKRFNNLLIGTFEINNK